MPILAISGILPGNTGVFTAQPVDKNGNPAALPAGLVPAWASSDPTNAPVTWSADGLTASVITTAAFTGCKLSIAVNMPDGTQPTGTETVPVLTFEVAAFVIAQTS